jgi:uncharacterized membrane protein
MKAFLKTTIVGGVLFLLPLVLLMVVLGHAMRFAVKIAQPIASHLHLEHLSKISGVGIVTIVAVLVLIVVSFAAGLVARTGTGKSLSQWFENSILGGLPQYQLAKSMAEGLAQVESAGGLKPALINVEDGWQIGYLIDSVADGWVTTFVPQAPTPMSGNIMYLPAERVRPLNISMVQAMGIVKHIGAGSADALRGVDLRLPRGV